MAGKLANIAVFTSAAYGQRRAQSGGRRLAHSIFSSGVWTCLTVTAARRPARGTQQWQHAALSAVIHSKLTEIAVGTVLHNASLGQASLPRLFVQRRHTLVTDISKQDGTDFHSVVAIASQSSESTHASRTRVHFLQ